MSLPANSTAAFAPTPLTVSPTGTVRLPRMKKVAIPPTTDVVNGTP